MGKITSCDGCALKPGAKANLEANNRLTAVLCALGGLPFFCHEKAGWTSDKENYPQGKKELYRVVNTLMSAPSLLHKSQLGLPAEFFASEREALGKAPVCGGWRAAVQDLAKQGWFRDPAHRRFHRTLASDGAHLLDLVVAEPDKAERKRHIKDVGDIVKVFAADLKAAGVKVNLFD